jgi:hypothetical protein
VLYGLQHTPVLFADAGLEYIILNGLGYDPHGYFAQPPTLDDIRQVFGIQVHSSFSPKGIFISSAAQFWNHDYCLMLPFVLQQAVKSIAGAPGVFCGTAFGERWE